MLTEELLRRVLTPMELTALRLYGQGVRDPEEMHMALLAAGHTTTLTAGGYDWRTGEETLSVRVHRRAMTGGIPTGRASGGGSLTEKPGPMADGPRAIPTADELAAALESARKKIELLARRNGHEPEREKPPPEPVHRPLTGPALGAARQRVRARRKRAARTDGQANGKPVILPGDATPPAPKEEPMSTTPDPAHDYALPDVPAEGFADRVQREAGEEAERVLADLARLRFRADQVARVMKALDLPIPTPVQHLAGMPVPREAVPQPPAALPAAESPAEPSPGPDPAQTPDQPETAPGEPAAVPDAPATPQEPVVEPPPETPPIPKEERTLTEPGPVDLVSVELTQDDMPALKGKRRTALVEKIAAEQLLVLRHVHTYETTIGLEVVETTGLDQARIGEHLRNLRAAKLIAVTGINRRRIGKKVGKPSLEYRPLQPTGRELPLIPGEEEVPEYEARRRGLLAQLREHGEMTSIELAKAVGADVARVADDLRMLEKDGRARRVRDLGVGQPSVWERVRPKITVVDEDAEEKEERAESDKPLTVDAGDFAKVRDWAQKQKKPFAPADVSKAVMLPEDTVRGALTSLIERSCLEYVGLDDLELYQFVKPTEPGAAAKADAERHAREARGNGRGASEPVAGTGSRLRGSGPHAQLINTLLDDVIRCGCSVEPATSGHIAIGLPEGGRITIAKSPGTARSVMDSRARLRQRGVRLP